MADEPKAPNRSEVARKLLEVAAALLDRDEATHTVLARLERVTAWALAGAPPKPPKAKPAPTPEDLEAKAERERAATQGEQATVERLWAYWQAQTGKLWGLNPARRGKLLAALRAGYDEAKIQSAIRGMMLTPHNNGTSKGGDGQLWIDADILCRSIDRFADVGGWRPTSGPVKRIAVVNDIRVKQLEREIEDAERRGDTARVARLEAELAAFQAGGGDRSSG